MRLNCDSMPGPRTLRTRCYPVFKIFTTNPGARSMSRFYVVFALLLAASSWAEEPADDDTAYKQPYPHSSGAELLPYCEQTDVVVSQLRCDYYVQAVADMATIPKQGVRAACIPRGQNRTQLMLIATTYLKTVKPQTLEQESAASIILKSFRAAFPCPKVVKKTAMDEKTNTPAVSKEMAAAIKKVLLEKEKAQQKAASEVPDEQ